MNSSREIKKIAVNVLNDQREIFFAQIRFARFADGAVDRVGPERLVIRAAIIIAGETETGRNPQNQKCRRERQPAGHHAGSVPNARAARCPKIPASKTARDNWRRHFRHVKAIPVAAGMVVHVAHALNAAHVE